MRIAAGSCVIVTGLLVASAGGGIASADTDASAKTASGANQSTAAAPSHANPLAKVAQGVASTAQGIANTVGSLTGQRSDASSQHRSLLPRLPIATFGGTPTVYGSIGADPTPVAVTPPVADVDAVPDAETVATDVAPLQTSAQPPLPAADLVAAATNVVTPASNVAAALTNAAVSVPGVVIALPGSANPVEDVLTSLQTTVTSVADAAAPLVQVPSDLSALLGDLYPATSVPTEVVGADSMRPAPTTGAPLVLPATSGLSQLLLPTASPGTAPAPGDPTSIVPLGGHASASSTVSHGQSTDAVASTSDGSGGVLSTVEKVIGVFVASVSVLALLAVALPGVGGIVLTWAAGVRIGYRQAKAAASLPSLGAARFVGSGPMGVVRSGSQVSLRPRGAQARDAGAPEPMATVFSIKTGSRVA